MPKPITTSKKFRRKRHRTINEEGNAMTVTTMTLGSKSEVDHRSALRRAVIASTVGTTIEWYDFLIYSTVTGLVFNKVYFPGSDPWVGTLQAFGVYFIGAWEINLVEDEAGDGAVDEEV